MSTAALWLLPVPPRLSVLALPLSRCSLQWSHLSWIPLSACVCVRAAGAVPRSLSRSVYLFIPRPVCVSLSSYFTVAISLDPSVPRCLFLFPSLCVSLSVSLRLPQGGASVSMGWGCWVSFLWVQP